MFNKTPLPVVLFCAAVPVIAYIDVFCSDEPATAGFVEHLADLIRKATDLVRFIDDLNNYGQILRYIDQLGCMHDSAGAIGHNAFGDRAAGQQRWAQFPSFDYTIIIHTVQHATRFVHTHTTYRGNYTTNTRTHVHTSYITVRE